MKNIGLSVKRSFLSVLALAGLVFSAGAYAVPVVKSATVAVYGSVSDITENSVVLTGDATVTGQRVPATATTPAMVTLTLHFNNVAGRSVMSGVALRATADFTATVPASTLGSLSFPITIFPAGSDALDPAAFTATAAAAVSVNPAGLPAGGLSQFTIVLTPVPAV